LLPWYEKSINENNEKPFFLFSSFSQISQSNNPLVNKRFNKMKITPALVALVSLCTSSIAYDGSDYDDSDFFTLDSALGGCIGRQLDDDELLLMSCSATDDALQWRWDDQGRFHSKVDDTECMQVGRGRRIRAGVNKLRHGIKLYIKPCSSKKRVDFQTFDDSFEIEGGLSGPLFLEARPELCVVSRGTTANLGTDPIMLVKCNKLDEKRALGWEADTPNTNDFNGD
jgi:hypothetical protein